MIKQSICRYLLIAPCLMTLWGGTVVAQTTEQNINDLGEITNVDQLQDVKPTDWAYESLKNLAERYGCLQAENNRFRGDRALTRYEFASQLTTCLQQIEKLIASSTANFLTKDDLNQLQKLGGDFAPELQSLNTKVANLEEKTSKLEQSQFSTTTKLNGEVVMVLNGIAAGQKEAGENIAKNTAFGTRTRINFDSSFTGKDILRTRFQIVNQSAFSLTSTGTPEGDLRFNAGAEGSNNVSLDALLYSFPLGDKTSVVIEANAAGLDDFTNTINPYIDGDGGSGSLSNFGTRNPIYYIGNGSAGLGVKHQFNDKLELSASYLANNNNDPTPGNGFFNGSYALFGQLAFKPQENLTVAFAYANSYNTTLATGSNLANTTPVSSNSYGLQGSWKINPKFVVNGWAGYTNSQVLDVTNRGSLDIWNWAIALAAPDLGKKGNLAGLIVGSEPRVTGVTGNYTKDPNTSLHIEGFYQHQLTDNIVITPGIIWLTAPNHNNNNDDIIMGVVRSTFTF
jgi:Carbohydrate-selective porin, OprB family/S-layer homology domain